MNYVQPDYRIPVTAAMVQPHQPGAVSGNPLALTGPLAKYAQPDTAARPLTGALTGPMGNSKIVRADGTSSST